MLAGLHELEAGRSAELETRLSTLREEMATATRSAQADAERAEQELRALHGELATSHEGLRAARAQTKKLRADLHAVKGKQAKQTAALRDAEHGRRSAEALLVHHAHCATCDKLVPETEWAEEPAERGVYVYHRTDGFRLRPTLLQRPTVLFWRAQPSGRDGQ